MLTIFEQITETEHIHFNYISILRSQSEWFVCVSLWPMYDEKLNITFDVDSDVQFRCMCEPWKELHFRAHILNSNENAMKVTLIGFMVLGLCVVMLIKFSGWQTDNLKKKKGNKQQLKKYDNTIVHIYVLCIHLYSDIFITFAPDPFDNWRKKATTGIHTHTVFTYEPYERKP